MAKALQLSELSCDFREGFNSFDVDLRQRQEAELFSIGLHI